MTPETFLELAKILPEPAVLLKSDGEILSANQPFLRIVSLTPQTITGRNLTELVSTPAGKIVAYLQNCSRTRQMIPGGLEFFGQRGKTLEFRCEGAVVELANGNDAAKIFLRLKPKEAADSKFILLTQKIDQLNKGMFDRQRTEEEIRKLYLEAVEANRLKDEFLATVSHELRTPLNSILGWSRLLSSNNLNGKNFDKAIETIERNALSQARLIEDLLDVSRIITGKLRLDVRRIEVASIIESAIETIRPAAENKSVRLEVLIDSRADIISGDPERLQQIIWNLLSNAIRFTPEKGHVKLQIERVNAHVEISISDTGVGIEPEFLPYVFDRFRQADASKTRKHGGLGLGLSIVRNLVELHGGTAHVFSDGIGKGATFKIKLPLVIAGQTTSRTVEAGHENDLPASEVSSGQTYQPVLTDMHLLVVDDEPDARELLSVLLENCGAKVTLASSAAEALKKLRQNTFNVLISDIEMPGEDGYTLIEKIRALSEAEHGKIGAIALTAYASTTDRRNAMAAGFDAHIAKPFDTNELLKVITGLTRGINKTSAD